MNKKLSFFFPAFSTNHHKSRTLSSNHIPYYTFSNAINSTNSSTITHSYSSNPFSPGVHNLKGNSANVSPIRIFDLTIDDAINAPNIIQSTYGGISKHNHHKYKDKLDT